ncbi:MAG: hypothetical protein NT070_14400 [Cyanobacteria bacterium]|nr:hypothetical protein [Cyanobacteriota bacterium]
MSTLSNLDIEKEIGINICIYPFSKKNLRGASYNLTVSKLAWDIVTKKSIYDPQSNKLVIPNLILKPEALQLAGFLHFLAESGFAR